MQNDVLFDNTYINYYHISLNLFRIFATSFLPAEAIDGFSGWE